jgi:hypothetical protein
MGATVNKFKVRGWVGVQRMREPLGHVHIIEAKDGKEAAREYARRYCLMDMDWWNAGPSPAVVIRTSNVEDKDP